MSKRLGDLLEAMARERQQPQVGEQLERVHDILDTIQGRLALLEERQDFTDQLLNDPERRRILSTRSRRGHDSGLGGVGLDGGPVRVEEEVCERNSVASAARFIEQVNRDLMWPSTHQKSGSTPEDEGRQGDSR
jgi:hypothetical protein